MQVAAQGETVSRETKAIRRINKQDGTLTDRAGIVANVCFSLMQTQDYVDGLPTLRSAQGTLEFEKTSEAWDMFHSPEKKTLKGGGIQAEVLVVSVDSFRVTGALNDI